MAASDEQKSLNKLLEQQKKLKKDILDLADKGQKASADEKSKLSELRAEYKQLYVDIRQGQAQQLRGFAEQQNANKSLSGIYSNLTTLEEERISKSMKYKSLTDEQQTSISKVAALNRGMAQLTAEQSIEKQAYLLEIDAEMAKMGKVHHTQQSLVDNLQAQTQEASRMGNLTKSQKDSAEKLLSIQNKVKDAVGGVLDTFSTLTSGPMGFLGTALIGAGFAMDKLGHSAHELGTFMTESTVSATALSFVFKDAVGMASALAGELGGVEEATFGTQLKANLLAHNLNLSSSEAANLMGSFARLNGGSADMAADMMATTKEFAKQQGVIPAKVAGMLANNTEAFALFGKEGGKNMIEAAAAAAKMGVEMSSLTGMADGLLDIENSLNKELELGAMLGKNINFDKARQLAFEGDLVGAQKEMLKQVGGRAAIENMNYYQLKETAAAMGVSVGELQKMAQNSDKVAESQSALSKGFSYMSEGFKFLATGPLGTFTKGLGSAAIAAGQMGFDVKGMIGSTTKVAKNFLSMIPGVGKISSGMGGLTEKLSSTKLGKGMSSFKDKLMGGVGDKSEGVVQGAKNKLKDASSKIPKGGGDKISGKGSIMEGTSKIKMSEVLKGAAAMLIVAAAVFVFAKAIQEFAEVSWSQVGMAVVSMLALVGSIALLGMIMSGGMIAPVLAGAAAMLIVAASMYVLGKAIQEIGKGAGTDLMAIGVSLLGFGLAVAPLGLLAIPLMLAAGALTIMGIGLTAFGIGLRMIPFETLNLVKDTLTNVVPLTSGILSLAAGITALAGSLTLLGVAGIAALPGLMALSMVGGISMALGGLFGGDEEGGGDESMEALLTEIQGLRADLNAGKVAVYLDGAKVTSGIRNVVNGAKVNSYGL